MSFTVQFVRVKIMLFCPLVRSPAIVIAYLMKCKGWRFAQSYQWVKERRPSVELSQGLHMIQILMLEEALQ